MHARKYFCSKGLIMGKTILFLFILVHGLIHLIGFVKGFNLAEIPAFSGKTLFPVSRAGTQVLALFWLLTCLLFLLSATGLLFHREWWWLPAVMAIVLSQLLVIIYWPDARAGTIANIILLPFVIIAGAGQSFNSMVNNEVKAIGFYHAGNVHDTIRAESIERLPYCVQKWLLRSGVVGKENVHTLYLKQKGAMCTKPGGKWMPTGAEQYFNTDQPAFVWKARVQMMPGLVLAGRDKFLDGKGNMLIKAGALLPIVNASGEKTDQGTMLRYLGEMCWFPSAALSPYIKWEELGATEARATMAYKGMRVSGIYRFTPDGDFASFSAQRYMDDKGKISLENWYIPASEWKEMDGIRIPVKGVVTWKLKTGDFDYYKWEITEIAHNRFLK